MVRGSFGIVRIRVGSYQYRELHKLRDIQVLWVHCWPLLLQDIPSPLYEVTERVVHLTKTWGIQNLKCDILMCCKGEISKNPQDAHVCYWAKPKSPSLWWSLPKMLLLTPTSVHIWPSFECTGEGCELPPSGVKAQVTWHFLHVHNHKHT